MKRGFRPGDWTEEENALLREHYPTGGAEAVMLYVTRSKKAIRMHAEVLGITTSHGPAPWTPEQEAIVREKYFDLGAQAVGELIGRTAWGGSQVRREARRTGQQGPRWDEASAAAGKGQETGRTASREPEAAARCRAGHAHQGISAARRGHQSPKHEVHRLPVR